MTHMGIDSPVQSPTLSIQFERTHTIGRRRYEVGLAYRVRACIGKHFVIDKKSVSEEKLRYFAHTHTMSEE